MGIGVDGGAVPLPLRAGAPLVEAEERRLGAAVREAGHVGEDRGVASIRKFDAEGVGVFADRVEHQEGDAAAPARGRAWSSEWSAW